MGQRGLRTPPGLLNSRHLKAEVAQSQGERALDSQEHLWYHDFLNIMLGRQRRAVYLWMYDISNGKADSWSWLLGSHFPAFWHTAVVVDFDAPRHSA